MKAYITVGISASGKTTWASKQDAVDINRDYIRFNVVCPGKDWSSYKFSGANENEVTKIQEQLVMQAHSNGKDIVISDTNLNNKIRNKWVITLTDLGYEVEVVEFPIVFEEAVKRDKLRPNSVGKDVIYTQYQKWLEYKGRKVYTPDTSLPNAIIVDVDGTIAEMNGRGPFEWDKVGTDKPRSFVVEMVNNYYEKGYEVIICSGRSDECKYLTHSWLEDNLGEGLYGELHMRKEGDFRKDNEVKEEIFWTNIADRYNVVACIDDRPQMIRLWYELKIPNVIAVANPYIEF